MEKTFNLKSFKLGNGVASCKYLLSETTDGITTEQEFCVKCTRPLHRDLLGLFYELSDLINRVFDLPGAGACGISFSGADGRIGAVISGVIETPYGAMKVKTPRIRFQEGDSGACVEQQHIYTRLMEEVQAYLFEGKSAELVPFN